MNVRPPIVTVPERDLPGFAAAAIVTVPLPVPEAPLEIVKNDALLVAVHVQVDPPETSTDTLPPPLLAFNVEEDNVIVQLVGATSAAAACVYCETAPLTAMLAERAAPVLAAML